MSSNLFSMWNRNWSTFSRSLGRAINTVARQRKPKGTHLQPHDSRMKLAETVDKNKWIQRNIDWCLALPLDFRARRICRRRVTRCSATLCIQIIWASLSIFAQNRFIQIMTFAKKTFLLLSFVFFFIAVDVSSRLCLSHSSGTSWAESINTFSTFFLPWRSCSADVAIFSTTPASFPSDSGKFHRREFFRSPFYETFFAGDLFTVEFLVQWIALNAISISGVKRPLSNVKYLRWCFWWGAAIESAEWFSFSWSECIARVHARFNSRRIHT